jgi:mono/diheme cytochrome c family protein
VAGRRLFGVLCVLAVAIVAYAAVAWRPAIAPIETPAPQSFAPDLVARGRMLASGGNCATCHTEAGGQAFAGGYAMQTPFGTIYTTNITPDRETGIGRWSLAAFTRAMREGVSRDGRHLFPAFPYTHFALMTDEDIGAIYAYLMTVPPVKAEPRANTLPFPLDVRALQAGWKMLFFKPEPFRPDPERSTAWNRGAYLSEGLAHCAACHTPRNILGAESVGHPYYGALIENDWWAWPLHYSFSPVAWTKDELASFLRGNTTVHGRATGPMGPVVQSLAALPDSDIDAIATYFGELIRPVSAHPEKVVADVMARSRSRETGAPGDRGRQLYYAACAGCHDDGGSSPLATRMELMVNSALWYPRPNNFVLAVLDGVGSSPTDAKGPLMPPLRDALNDEEIVAIANYLRIDRLRQPGWPAYLYKVDRLRDHPPPELKGRDGKPR